MGSGIEIDDSYHGYRYAVVIVDHGHRCGYVQIPAGHPWHGEHYDNLNNIAVHGGVTFSGPRMNEDGWWIGFDCAHSGDFPDLDMVHREMRVLHAETICVWLNIPKTDIDNKVGVKSTKYVAQWCEKLIDQAIKAQQELK